MGSCLFVLLSFGTSSLVEVKNKNRVVWILSVCFSLFLDNFIWNAVKFSTYLDRKWESEWVGEEVSSIVYKSLVILSFCFALFLDNSLSMGLKFAFNFIGLRCHNGGGNVVCLFFFVSWQIHFEIGSCIQYKCIEMRSRSGLVGGIFAFDSLICVKKEGFLLFCFSWMNRFILWWV